MENDMKEKIEALEKEQLLQKGRLDLHHGRIKTVEVFQKREEASKKSRSIILTPFEGDRKDYVAYKKDVARFIQALLGADSPAIESIMVWSKMPTVTVTFSLSSTRDKIMDVVKQAFGRIKGVNIYPDRTLEARLNFAEKRKHKDVNQLNKLLKQQRNMTLDELDKSRLPTEKNIEQGT